MKNKIHYILLLVLSFLVINCSTDDNYKAETSFKFPFTLEVTKDRVYYAQEQGNIKLTPELEIDNEKVRLDYYFTITSDNPDVLIYYKNELITSKKQYRLIDENTLQFKFKKIGQYTVNIKFENQYGFVLEKSEVFNVKDIDFYVTLTNEDKIYPRIAKDLALEIQAKEGEEDKKDIKYKVSLELENHPETSEKLEISYAGKKVSLKEEFSYSTGEIKIKFPVSGDYDFNVIATSSQGKQVVKKQIIKVDPVKFNFDLNSTKKVYPLDKNLFKIKTENLEEEILQKFSFKYNVTTGVEPQIVYNNSTLAKNVSTPVSGEDIYIVFPKVGLYNIKMTMENQYGFILEKEFAFDVNYANFDIKISNLPAETFIQNEYSFNVEPQFLKEEASKVDYTFKVKASPNTKVYYDDRLLNNDVYTNYSSSKIKVVFAKEEATDIEFIFKNSQGLEISKKQSFDVRIADFDLDVVREDKYLPNKKTPLKFKVVDKSGLKDLDYTFNVVTNSPSAKFYYNSSLISKDLNHKYTTGDLEVLFDKEGAYEVTITAKNSHGKTISKKLVIQVDPVNFNLSIVTDGKIYPNEQKHFVLKINKEDKEDQTYTFSYVIKGGTAKPTVNYNSYLVTENQTVNYNGQDLFMTFPKVGLYEIEFTVKNNFGTVVKEKVNYDVNYANFDVLVNNVPTSTFIDTKYSLNVLAKVLNEGSSNQKYTMKIEGSPSMKAFYKGYQISLNNFVDYTESKVDLLFTETGQQEVVFILKNSQGLEVSKKIIVNPKTASFDLDIIKDKQYLSNTRGKLQVKTKDNSGLSNLSYKFNVTYPQDLKVFYNGSQIASGMQLNYVGSNFEIESAKSGDYELNFSFENSQGYKIQQKVVVQIDAVKFNYSMEIEGKIYPDIKKSFKLIPVKETDIEQTYKVKYVAKGNKPTITYNGNTLYENEYVSFTNNNLNILFKEIGQQDVEFTIQNQYGYTVPKNFRFTVGQTKFDIEADNLPKEVYVNKDFDISLTPKADDQINLTYEMKILGSDVIATYNGYTIPNNNYVSYNSSKIGLRFSKVGKQEVTVVMKNNQGLEITKKLIFDVISVDTDVTFTLADKIYPTVETSIKTVIKGTTIEGLKHKFKIKSSDTNVIVKHNNSQLAFDNFYDYKGSDFLMTFPKSGRYTLTWDFENNLGGSTQKVIIVDVVDTTYEVRIISPSEVYPRANQDFNFKVVEKEDAKSTYQFKYSISGGTGEMVEVRQNGKYQYPDEWIDYVDKPFTFIFPKAGLYIINLEFKNKYGKIVSQRQEVRVLKPTFDLNITPNRLSVKQGESVDFSMLLTKKPTNQEVKFSIKSDNRELISSIKYNSRNITFGEEVIYDNNKLSVFFSTPGKCQITIDFFNNDDVRVVKTFEVDVTAVDNKTEITARVADAKINGYESTYYFNPVKVAVNLTSLAPSSDFKIRLSNPYLIHINGTIAPNSWMNYSENTNTYTLQFENTVFSAIRNNLKIEVQDKYGQITETTLNVPVNKKPDPIIFLDFDESKIKWHKTKRDKGYRVDDLDIKPFKIKSKIKPTKVVAKIWITTSRYYEFEASQILKIDDDTYEVRIFPDIDFYERDHNNDKGRILIEATDNYPQKSEITINTMVP